MQQRGIPPLIVDLLRRFGKTTWCHGAKVCFFDKRSRKRVSQYLGSDLALSEKYLNVYLVQSNNGKVITTAYRDRRIRLDS